MCGRLEISILLENQTTFTKPLIVSGVDYTLFLIYKNVRYNNIEAEISKILGIYEECTLG